MLRIGCHLSFSKGYLAMGREALSIGANTFQYFSRNPRGGSAKALDPADIAAFQFFAAEHDIAQILTHAPYTLNAASKDPRVRDFARLCMGEDLQKLEHLPGSMYNFHPGAHVGQGAEEGIRQIADLLDEILWPEMHTTVLLETMAGKGTEIGRTFEELRKIISRTKLSDKLGVCLDTCHVWDGGYDIKDHLDEVLEEFDRVIGLERLKAIHLNDSKNPLGAHKDRHEKIGQGAIGSEALLHVVTHPALKDLPFFLETPNDLDGYADEIRFFRERS